MGAQKRFHNLIGYTVGTGLGIGIVINGHLNRGDNSCVETFCLPHPTLSDVIIEEGASTRAVCRVYGELTGENVSEMNARDIAEIANGNRPGNATTAQEAFAQMGRTLGAAIATAATLIDGIVVLGGGVMAAKRWIMPSLMDALHATIHTLKGENLPRMQMKVYDLDNKAEFEAFAKGESRTIKVYGSDKEVVYDPVKRIGVTISDIGASNAVSLGAYLYAINNI
jgi:predicted NBD/HSP70 family sugar kinase